MFQFPPNPIVGQTFNPAAGINYRWNGKGWAPFSQVSVPTGTILDFGGTTAPQGFLICDGSAVSRTTYATLFTAIGTTWGAGDGSTTFNLPDLRRYATIGSGGTGAGWVGTVVGNRGGQEAHVLTAGEMPSHSHTGITSNDTVNHTHSGTTGNENQNHNHSGNTGTVSADHSHYITTGGASAQHNHHGVTYGNNSNHQHNADDGNTLLGSTGDHTHGFIAGYGDSGLYARQANTSNNWSSHAHEFWSDNNNGDHSHSGWTGGISANHSHSFDTGWVNQNHNHSFGTSGVSAWHQHYITAEGGGAAANIMQPSAVVLKIIKT